jgi:hypothetical protein
MVKTIRFDFGLPGDATGFPAEIKRTEVTSARTESSVLSVVCSLAFASLVRLVVPEPPAFAP